MKFASAATRPITAMLLSACAVFATQPAAQAAPVPGQGTWQTTLQARDLDGNGQTDAFYDTVLNITWLRDANANRAADLNNFAQFGAHWGGSMTWTQANTWANNLTFGGYTDWRLPTMVDTGAAGCDRSYDGTDCGYNVQTTSTVGTVTTVYSEMASLSYDTLGNKGFCARTPLYPSCSPQPGWGLSNTGDFIGMQPYDYWFGLVYEPFTNLAWWEFDFQEGSTAYGFEFPDAFEDNSFNFAMAVRDGDVTAASVPEPGALVLAAMALASLGGVRRWRAAGVLRH